MSEMPPWPVADAAMALGRCAMRTGSLVVRRRIHQPHHHVGDRLHFADGTDAPVYRETVVDRGPTGAPAVLVVQFRLRRIRGALGHALFRRESVLNTLLFAGFPGFVSKLWLAHDQHGVYRGVYEWDDPALAEGYVRALWWVLALVSEPTSIKYSILPGIRRDDLLGAPDLAGRDAPGLPEQWWRLTDVLRAS